MQSITPFLWFDNNAEQAIGDYVEIFDDARVERIDRIEGGPGDGMISAEFVLEGRPFMAIDGGPHYRFSPATSFFVHTNAREKVDRLWERLTDGGSVMMPLDTYPYSERYGWVQDRYGVSWQVMLADNAPPIVPCLLFVGNRFGSAEDAIRFYTSLFPGSAINELVRDPEAGTVMYGSFRLGEHPLVAMESGHEHAFDFTPAISLYLSCNSQEEVDRYWDRLAEGGQIMQCGWLTDRFGVTWQVVPAALKNMLADSDRDRVRRVTECFLGMEKIELAALEQAAASVQTAR
jgi:predicted 3-demethylubiquinone-9 3-methyltransferase (glyoxalase superfamily)